MLYKYISLSIYLFLKNSYEKLYATPMDDLVLQTSLYYFSFFLQKNGCWKCIESLFMNI